MKHPVESTGTSSPDSPLTRAAQGHQAALTLTSQADLSSAGPHQSVTAPPGAHTPKRVKPEPIPPERFPHGPQGWNRTLAATVENVEFLLDHYGVKVRYDSIKKKLRIEAPGLRTGTDNADNTAVTEIMSLVSLNGMPIGQVPALLEAIGDRHLYNPVEEWIKARAWDGVDRLPQMFDTLVVREGFSDQLKRIIVYKWLLSAAAAAVLPRGFKARGVLTMQGPQGIGKTSWVMALVNDPELREKLIKVDHHLDPHNKDSILGAITHWVVEVGELDSSFRKSDVARLKGVLTSDSDKVRRPYAKAEAEYQRRTVFCATVNESQFLVDHTGNTRWWTLPLASIDYQHGIDMQQVFAQLALDVEAGEQWWLTKDEETLLEQHNSDHRTVSLMRERLMEILDVGRPVTSADAHIGTSDLLKALGYDRPHNGDAKELTSILREMFGDPKKIKGSMKWRIPRKSGPEDMGPFVSIPD